MVNLEEKGGIIEEFKLCSLKLIKVKRCVRIPKN
jgi:hypothetical protein